jgi:eukaryotic-like serine/threonine-protein kinase
MPCLDRRSITHLAYYDMLLFMLGPRLAHYEILDKLGSGGMGDVYRARDLRLNRTVAIKVLPAGKLADPVRKQRLLQEARAASALNHPNIVTLYDIPEEDGTMFLVMEYVSGKALDELIPAHGMSWKAVLKYAVQIADALAAAHAARIVHRDIKPSNIMVTEQGRVKVLDFGLAKMAEAASRAEHPENSPTLTIEATRAGQIMGTAAYMSPEQAEGKQVDTRSDVFSFGAVLYEMLTGQRAFPGDNWASTVATVIKNDPRPIRELAEGVPRELQRIVERCLRKDLDRRGQSIAEMKLELEQLIEDSSSATIAAPQAVRAGKPWRLFAMVALAGSLVRQPPGSS